MESAQLKYGEEFGDGLLASPAADSDEPFERGRVAGNDGQRAMMLFPSSENEKDGIYLVKVNGRWWVSGYTFEYLPDAQEFLNGPQLAEAERMTQSLGREAKALQGQMNSGQLQTADQFMMAVMGSFMKIAAESPEAQELMEAFGSMR